MVALAIFCAALMAFSFQIPNAAASGGGGTGGTFGPSNATSSESYFPYSVRPSLFPAAANLSPASGVSGVAAAPLPGAPAGFAVVLASSYGLANSTIASLSFEQLNYNAQDAQQIALNGSCGINCGALPLNWSVPSVIANFSAPITAESVAVAGSALVVASTSGGYTYLFNWSASLPSWRQFGPVVGGSLASLAANPGAVVVATLASGQLTITTVSVDGGTLGQHTVTPAGTSTTGVSDAGVALVPDGSTYLAAVAFSTMGSNEIQFAASTDGTHFSSSSLIGNYTPLPSPSAVPTAGETSLSYPGGVPGQVSMVAAESELVLLYTTYNSNQVVPATEASATLGTSWQGPYYDGPVNGSAFNPSLAVGPTGLVYATWEDPDLGQGAVEEATYFADGSPLVAPEAVLSPDGRAVTPSGGPTVAVDGFARPLVAWPTQSVNPNGSVAYTGGYLSVNESVPYFESAAGQSLTPSDFPNGSAGALASFQANVSLTSQEITSNETNLSSEKLCAIQNLTGMSLYPNGTHLPLSILPGTGTVCSAHLTPSTSASPLVNAQGSDFGGTYLAVYADWALESEGVPVAVSPLASLAQFNPYLALVPETSLPASPTTSVVVNSTTESVTVTPTPYSPTAYDLTTSGTLQGWGSTHLYTCFFPNGGWAKGGVGTLTRVTSTWTNVSVNNGPAHSFNGTSSFNSVWVYDLPAYQSFSWTGTFTAHTTATTYSFDQNCHPTSTSRPGPVIGPMSLGGSFATTLSESYGSGLVTATYNANRSTARLSVGFSQTLPAAPGLTLTNATGSQSWSSSIPVIPVSYGFPNASSVGISYSLSVGSTSRAGSSTAPGSPSFAYGASGSAPAETASSSCGFTLTKYVPTVWNASTGPYSNLSGSTVTVQWFSNESAPGFFTYYEVTSAVNYTISGLAPVAVNPTTWAYSLEVHGLEPWGIYNGTFGVSTASGCLVTQDGVSKQVPVAGPDPGPSSVQKFGWAWEQDLLYDSISKTGGGMEVGWSHRSIPCACGQVFTGGTLTVGSPSNPIFTYPIVPTDGANGSNGLSGSVTLDPLLTVGTTYPIELALNYTLYHRYCGQPNCPPTNRVIQANGTFTYEKDWSGDGLTDVEKQQGWIVPGIAGTMTPNFRLYSSNGVASDYLEKQLDLDPFTLDTANSGMLDLWNLTFDLGANSSNPSIPKPKDFHLWWEVNASRNPSDPAIDGMSGGPTYSFDPFAGAPYPGDTSWSGAPLATGLNNITCTKSSCAGNSSWSAQVLWSRSALGRFENLPGFKAATANGGWFRGIVGTYNGERTLTLWGKMSWGANPLVSSTPGDGIPDGSRVNPVYAEDLQINFGEQGPGVKQLLGTNWSYGACGESASEAFALQFWVNGTGSSAPPEMAGNYSKQVNGTGLCNGTSGIEWAIPIDPTLQYQNVAIQMIQSSGSTLSALPVNGSSKEVQVTLDMLNPPPVDYQPGSGGAREPWFFFYNDNPLVGPITGLEFGLTGLPAGEKAPTLLWEPTDGSTVSSLSGSLSRYVGAQNFVLVVADASTALSVSNVPAPDSSGGTYSLNLVQGLDNILVPSGVFFNSTLGQALFLNKTAPYTGSSTPPLLGPGDAGTLITGGNNGGGSGYGSLSDLACYWQDRAVLAPNSTSVPLCSANELPGQGVTAASGLALTVDSPPSATCTEFCGGVPTEPGLETGQASLPALGAILGLQVSSSAEIDALLAGIIDNTTGGVNGSFVGVQPYEVGTLDLPTVVLDALANLTTLNTPLYGAPVDPSIQPESSCGWPNPGACLAEAWNTFEGAITGVGKFVYQTVVTYVWNPIVAGTTYLAGLAKTAANKLNEYVVEPTVNFLSTVGAAIKSAIGQLLNFLVTVVQGLLSPVVSPIVNAVDQYTEQLASDIEQTYSDAAAGKSVTNDAETFWSDVGASVFLLITVVAITITVVLTIIEGFSLGAGFLVPIVIGLVLNGSAKALADAGGPSFLSDFQGINPVSPSLATEWGAIFDPPEYLATLGTLLGIGTTSWAAASIESAWENNIVPEYSDEAGFALGVIGLVTAGAAAYYSTTAGAIASLLFDGSSAGIDIYAVLHEPSIENAVVLAIDGATVAIDAHTLGLPV